MSTSTSTETPTPGAVRDGDEARSAAFRSVIYHFGTSGVAVATATGITHPLALLDSRVYFPLKIPPTFHFCKINVELVSLSHEFHEFSRTRGLEALFIKYVIPIDTFDNCNTASDVLKVRLQMQLVGQRGPLTGMGELFSHLMKSEGPQALYLGLTPALSRSILYGGLRLGLYEPCKYVCNVVLGSTNLLVKIACGAFSGAVATALTNPTEVLKVRLQMNSRTGEGGAIRELQKIAKEEGIRALWKGVGPAMARASVLTASQLATYDESKQALMKWTPLEEGMYLHFISSAIAGIVGTLVTAPMDMIKTRLMLQQESKNAALYKNGFHCAYKVVRTEGPLSLYKGGFAIFARLGPQTTITFLVCEKLRELAGMKAI